MALPSWSDFLERLKRDGVIRRLDPRTMRAIEELLDSGLAHAPAEFSAALASLLATTPEQWRQVETRFLAFLNAPRNFLADGLPVERPPPVPAIAIELPLEPSRGPTSTTGGHCWLQWLATRRLRRAVGGTLLILAVAFSFSLAAGVIAVFRSVDVALQSPTTPLLPNTLPGGTSTPEPVSEDNASTTGQITTPNYEPEKPPPNTVAAPPSSPFFTIALMLFSAALVAVGLRWIAAPRAQRRHAMELHERDAADAQGPRVIYNVATYPPFPIAAMDAAATLLARLPLVGHGLDLDIPATLHATVRAGGRTTPVLAPTRTPQELTILVDIERGDHPFLAGVEWVLHRWTQGGLRFVRLSFEHHLGLLRTYPDRRETNLDALGRRFEGSPLVLFARATQLRDYDGGHGWLQQLGPWPIRAIVDLDPRANDDPALLPEERESRRALARAHFRRFPFTATGLTAMAHYVGSRGLARAPVPDEPLRSTTEITEYLERWASCLACVPDPSWAQLEVFRREFFAFVLPDPRYVQRLLDWVSRPLERGGVPDDPITADGTRVNLPRKKLHVHLARLDQADPSGEWRDLEVRARAIILQQLRGSDPHAAGDRRLRDLKLAQHEAILRTRHSRSHGDISGLEVFVGGPMEEDLERWVADQEARYDAAETTPPAWLPDLRRALKHDLQIAHLGHLLTARGLLEVTPTTLALAGAAWLSFGAWPPNMFSVAGAAGGTTGALWLALRQARRRQRPEPERPLWTPPYTPPPRLEDLSPITAPPTGHALGVIEIALAGIVPMRFIGLTGGEFTRGSPDSEPGRHDNEGPQCRVHVSPFAIAEHPVTVAHWMEIMGTLPADNENPNRPVVNVSWRDALEFLNRLSVHEGLVPCYAIEGGRVRWRASSNGYRLPTEAEWEYAARAGSTTAYSFGDNPVMLKRYAWFSENSTTPMPKGPKRPNHWGLYDMHGNVWEWVWDRYAPYAEATSKDPTGADGYGPVIVDGIEENCRSLRGGSFVFKSEYLRSAIRVWNRCHVRDVDIGFRVARGPHPFP